MQTTTAAIYTRAESLTAYVVEYGEADPGAPTTPAVDASILAFDGSDGARDDIFAAYLDLLDDPGWCRSCLDRQPSVVDGHCDICRINF